MRSEILSVSLKMKNFEKNLKKGDQKRQKTQGERAEDDDHPAEDDHRRGPFVPTRGSTPAKYDHYDSQQHHHHHGNRKSRSDEDCLRVGGPRCERREAWGLLWMIQSVASTRRAKERIANSVAYPGS